MGFSGDCHTYIYTYTEYYADFHAQPDNNATAAHRNGNAYHAYGNVDFNAQPNGHIYANSHYSTVV